jgi:hypothetical protein
MNVDLVQQAIAAGELPRDTDADLLIDAPTGPLYFRRIIGHAPVSEAFASELPRVSSRHLDGRLVSERRTHRTATGHSPIRRERVQTAPLLDLLAEDNRLNVYPGELEVRPPGAPTTGGKEKARSGSGREPNSVEDSTFPPSWTSLL